MARNGNVQAVKKIINMTKLSRIHLLHFIYVPLIAIYAISIGEDYGSIGLYIVLTFIVSFILYGYSLFVTKQGLRLFSNRYLAYGFPFLLLILLYLPLNWFLQEIDIGGNYGVFYILGGTLIINTISYYFLSQREY